MNKDEARYECIKGDERRYFSDRTEMALFLNRAIGSIPYILDNAVDVDGWKCYRLTIRKKQESPMSYVFRNQNRMSVREIANELKISTKEVRELFDKGLKEWNEKRVRDKRGSTGTKYLKVGCVGTNEE